MWHFALEIFSLGEVLLVPWATSQPWAHLLSHFFILSFNRLNKYCSQNSLYRMVFHQRINLCALFSSAKYENKKQGHISRKPQNIARVCNSQGGTAKSWKIWEKRNVSILKAYFGENDIEKYSLNKKCFFQESLDFLDSNTLRWNQFCDNFFHKWSIQYSNLYHFFSSSPSSVPYYNTNFFSNYLWQYFVFDLWKKSILENIILKLNYFVKMFSARKSHLLYIHYLQK